MSPLEKLLERPQTAKLRRAASPRDLECDALIAIFLRDGGEGMGSRDGAAAAGREGSEATSISNAYCVFSYTQWQGQGAGTATGYTMVEAFHIS